MSEEENMDTSGGPVSARATSDVAERIVRMVLRPSPRFGVKGDWKLHVVIKFRNVYPGDDRGGQLDIGTTVAVRERASPRGYNYVPRAS